MESTCVILSAAKNLGRREDKDFPSDIRGQDDRLFYFSIIPAKAGIQTR